MADPDPLIPVTERAAYLSRIHMGVTTPLLMLCLVTLGTRLYVRIRPVWKIGVDDVFIVLGLCLAIVDWTLIIGEQSMHATFIRLSTSIQMIKLAFISIPIWGLAMTCIKVSVAFSILRIKNTIRWKIFLFSIVALQIAYGIGNFVFLFTSCHPIEAAWNFYYPRESCVDIRIMRNASTIGTSVNVFTDIALSISPAFFLMKLQRPWKEKLLVCVLMGLGLFASAASICKMLIVSLTWGEPNADPWAQAISIGTWTVLEQFVAVFAACMPYLKNVVQRMLGFVGIALDTPSTSSFRRPRHGTDASVTVAGSMSSRTPKEEKGPHDPFPLGSVYSFNGDTDTIQLNDAPSIKYETRGGSGESLSVSKEEQSPARIV